MHKEQITDKEGTCIIAIFIMGSTLILGIGGAAKKDAWIAGIAGILMALPMILIYSRILSLFPGKDLFEILESIFGKIAGKMAAILYVWYSFHLGALVIRNFGEFVNTVAMPETPMFVSMLFLGLVCIAAVKSGVEVIGRMSAYLLPVIIIILAIVQVLAIPQFEISFMKPVLEQGIAPVLQGAFSAFSFPFAETVLLAGVFFSLKTKKSPYKVYFRGILVAGVVIIALSIRNILVLGDLLGRLYFPSHEAVARVRVGSFLQRIEVTVAFVFVVGAFVKASVCLFVASKGIGRIFNLCNYRSVAIQVGLLMIYFSYTVYDNIIEMKNWAFKVYSYYAFPFQVIIPLIMWIIAEVKHRKSSQAVKQE